MNVRTEVQRSIEWLQVECDKRALERDSEWHRFDDARLALIQQRDQIRAALHLVEITGEGECRHCTSTNELLRLAQEDLYNERHRFDGLKAPVRIFLKLREVLS